LADAGFAQIIPRVFAGPAGQTLPESVLALPGGQVPDWLALQAQPEHLREPYTDLLEILAPLPDRLAQQGDLSAVEVAILRCLIVHNWRRLALKHPALPAPLVSPDWPGHQCHLLVHRLLRDYPRPGLDAVAQSRAAA
jgi:phenylacetic acid degradation operon negative regulatory protein